MISCHRINLRNAEGFEGRFLISIEDFSLKTF